MNDEPVGKLLQNVSLLFDEPLDLQLSKVVVFRLPFFEIEIKHPTEEKTNDCALIKVFNDNVRLTQLVCKHHSGPSEYHVEKYCEAVSYVEYVKHNNSTEST